MRLLIPSDRAADVTPWTGEHDPDLTDVDLDTLYAHPGPLLRLGMVSTLDGAATGGDGVSGSIGSDADHRAFTALRRAADAVVVGRGTASAEGYRAGEVPLVVVSRRGRLPDGLAETASDSTSDATGRGGVPPLVLATCADSGRQDGERVWVHGGAEVDLAAVLERARSTYGPHLLCEGGPGLAGDLAQAGLVDEIALSWTPRLVGGGAHDHPRVLAGAGLDLAVRPVHLLEEDGTVVGLWQLS